MPQRFLLAQASILIGVRPESVGAFAGLSADERATANDHFRFALMGGNDEEQEELFEQLHVSEFRSPVPVDDEAQPEPEDLRALANRALLAYNARVESFDLTFAPIGEGALPSSVDYRFDPDAGDWTAVHGWRLTVATGNARGDDFNWLPLAEARTQGDYALPDELDFLLSGKELRADLEYRLTVTLSAE